MGRQGTECEDRESWNRENWECSCGNNLKSYCKVQVLKKPVQIIMIKNRWQCHFNNLEKFLKSNEVNQSTTTVTSQVKVQFPPFSTWFVPPSIVSKVHLESGLHIVPQLLLVHWEVVLGQPVGVQDGSHQSPVTFNVGEVLQDTNKGYSVPTTST